MFRIGARIVAVPAKNGALDALRGTQHLLTQAGRDILAAQYQAGYVAGAQVRAHRRCPRAPVQPTPPPSFHPSTLPHLLQRTPHLLGMRAPGLRHPELRRCGAGAQAVVTKLDTTVAFLEKNALWDDMERANDISYYEVAAPASAPAHRRLRASATRPPAHSPRAAHPPGTCPPDTYPPDTRTSDTRPRGGSGP